jgi:hypothetical protein
MSLLQVLVLKATIVSAFADRAKVRAKAREVKGVLKCIVFELVGWNFSILVALLKH